MIEKIVNRLEKLEQQHAGQIVAVATFADGHREKWDFHRVAQAVFDDRRDKIVSLEYCCNPEQVSVVMEVAKMLLLHNVEGKYK